MKLPKIRLRNGAPILIADVSARAVNLDAISRVVADASPSSDLTTSFRAIGYRQTLLPAAKGGKQLNSHGWRFRNGGMRALARSFRGQAFIGGHDWSDPRLRGGDIVDAWAEEVESDTEIAIFYDIIAKAPWAIEGLANGTIDRFSLGVQPEGEITCTVHDVPVWSTDDCWCWPGAEVEDGLIAEWEFEGGKGLELSAVNVPAVERTAIVEATADVDGVRAYRVLAALCGRQSIRASRELFGRGITAARAADVARIGARVTVKPGREHPGMEGMGEGVVEEINGGPALGVRFEKGDIHRWYVPDELDLVGSEGGAGDQMRMQRGGAPVGGFRQSRAPITMAVSDATPRGELMDRALLCKQLGLPATATDEEILAKIGANATAAAQAGVLSTQLAEVANREQQLAAERDAAHVESEITRLRASRVVSDAVVESLRASSKTSRTAFDSSLALVEQSAPQLAAALATAGAAQGTTQRATLQSDAAPATNPGAAIESLEDGPDAFEANRANPNLGKLMKQAGVTADDVRKHGSRSFNVLPNLRELADATAARS